MSMPKSYKSRLLQSYNCLVPARMIFLTFPQGEIRKDQKGSRKGSRLQVSCMPVERHVQQRRAVWVCCGGIRVPSRTASLVSSTDAAFWMCGMARTGEGPRSVVAFREFGDEWFVIWLSMNVWDGLGLFRNRLRNLLLLCCASATVLTI